MQLLDIEDDKDAVYGALDAWVAWERNFPIASLKIVIAILEKEHQWHRMVQVSITRMLSPFFLLIWDLRTMNNQIPWNTSSVL